MRQWKRVEAGLYTWSGRGHVCYIRHSPQYVKEQSWDIEFSESLIKAYPEIISWQVKGYMSLKHAKLAFENCMKGKKTYVQSMMNRDGPPVEIDWDCPYYCDPSTETYWSM